MKIDISRRLVSELNAGWLNDKVFPCVAMFDTDTPPVPYLVYQRTGAEFNYTKGLYTGDATHHYSFSIYSDSYAQTLTLVSTVIDKVFSLSYMEIDDEGFRYGPVQLVDISEDFIEGLFVQTLQFDIQTKEVLNEPY